MISSRGVAAGRCHRAPAPCRQQQAAIPRYPSAQLHICSSSSAARTGGSSADADRSSHTQRTTSSNSLASALQLAASSAAAAVLVLSSTPAAALAFGPVSVQLNDIALARVECGAGISTVGGVTFSGRAQTAACLEVSATASNPSDKPLFNADVFGRVYDANGEAAIDDTENIRIAYIDQVAPGKSTVTFKLNVPLEQYNLGPLSLKGFKATGFPGKMLPKTAGGALLDAQSTSDCEITGDCDDMAAAAAIR